ncbi:MAG: hypothetical protein FWC19_04020 [Treponema sp.]|nr:hypothetical protein [Treponema sp.]
MSDMDGKRASCFDTGLDPRSFARTKMSQSLIEIGYIVQPDGTHEVWRALGVNEVNGGMRVWGTPFPGERLDLLIDKLDEFTLQTGGLVSAQQTALQAVAFWIRAKMLIGDTPSAINPGAAFVVCEEGKEKPRSSVFFTPPNLTNRCLLVEGKGIDRFSCPDLTGMDAAAFSAGVMIYRILANDHPYSSDKTIFQDMRDGVFLPLSLAAPSLDKRIADLVQAALLLPVEKKRSAMSASDIINNLLKLLMTEDGIVPVSSLFVDLPAGKNEQMAKEKSRYLFRLSSSIKIKRFTARNKHAIIGVTSGLLFLIFILVSTTNSINRRATTFGMDADTVVMAYYNAFSSLDHMFMEACIQGADKSDINVAVNYYALLKTRQVYDSRATLVPAAVWKSTGGELPSPNVFGVTDLEIEHLSGREEDRMLIYRADYLLWSPEEYSITRSDVLTLKRDRSKNWRIVEIIRTER